ncbi:MAG: flagellar biosynthesis anti-sigma factor FlgM [Armatimonadota bacterium]
MTPLEGDPQRSVDMQVPKTGLHGVDAVSAVSKGGIKGAPGVAPKSEADQLTLSSAAAELQELRETFESIPDVREDEVRRIKQLIESGQYQIRDDAIAEKLLKLGVFGRE